MPRLVDRFLVRAPALPWSAASSTVESPEVTAALGLRFGAEPPPGVRRRTALRMSFRPTPAGLMAGVTVGRLGGATTSHLRGGRAHLEVTWSRLARLVRALLDDPAVRRRMRLRLTPSLLADGRGVSWLALGPDSSAPVRRLVLEPAVTAVLELAARWTPWPRLRRGLARHLGADEADADGLDDLLLQLVDDRLLLVELEPPLVGPPPLTWLRERLPRLPSLAPIRAELEALATLLEERLRHDEPRLPPRLAAMQQRLARLPGHSPEASLDGVLVLDGEVTLDRRAVERALGLAPPLLRLSAALRGSPWERAAGPALDGALATLVATREAGTFPLATVELAHHGVPLGVDRPSLAEELPPPAEAPDEGPPDLPAPLLRLLVSRLAEGGEVIELGAKELDAALPEIDLPPTVELVLGPAEEPPGSPPGSGWLLGLHGAAGATWGRFAAALGAPLQAALAELARLEEDGLPGRRLADLAYAPGFATAAVGAHPPLRPWTVALSSWPHGSEAVTAAELGLVLAAEAEVAGASGAPRSLGLVDRRGRAVEILPLARARGATVEEPGVHRLLAGWGLLRAVAPWAVELGPLGGLPRLPRLVVDGFVVMPASFALPPALLQACRSDGRRALEGWRREVRAPRWIQVGAGDRLLPVDLEDEGAAAELVALAEPGSRAYEIWPPLDRSVDESGRRLEAVVAALLDPLEPSVTAPPVVATTPLRQWRTYHLVGRAGGADRLLLGAVGPALGEGLAAREIDRWFVQRYRDALGRPELRLRVRQRRGGPPFGERLGRHLEAPREAGDLAEWGSGDYFGEAGRFGGPASLEGVHRLWQGESELLLDLLALDGALRPPSAELLARAFDALTRGLGLDLPARRRLGAARRRALDPLLRPDPHAPDPLATAFRQAQRPLAEALRIDAGRGRGDAVTPLLRRFRRRCAAAAAGIAGGRGTGTDDLVPLASTLCHLLAVRLVGPGEGEAVGTYFWERGLEAVAAWGRISRPIGRRNRRRGTAPT